MDEQSIRKIVQDEMQRNYRAGTTFVGPHHHNGIDNLRINQADIAPNIKANALIKSNTSEIFELDVTFNPTSVMFYGFAANNVSGPSSERALVIGNAQLGKSYLFKNSTSSQIVEGTQQPFIQGSCSLFIDIGSLNDTRVNASEIGFVYVKDNSGIEVATATVVSFSNTSVKIQTVLASGWEITGNFIIS